MQLPFHILLLLAAVAAGIVAQGGYYPPGRFLVAALVALAFVAALRERAAFDSGGWLLAVACAGLAAWTLARAAVQGSVAAGVPLTLTLACVVAGVLVVQGADAAQRELCAVSAVSVGVLVAFSGWIGVVWRIQPLALATDERLWRATSTLTYANAAAALLAPLAILSMALLVQRPSSSVRLGATFLLLVGLGATLSRGGVLALLVGLVLLGWLAGMRATTAVAAPPILGAALAVAALAPSFPITARPQPILALLGLVAGLTIAVGVPRLPGRVRQAALLAGFAGAAVAFAVIASSSQGMSVLADSRASLASPTRTESAKAALQLVADHPVAGLGPGQATFSWTTVDGQVVTGRYAHNEYLQVLVELGAIGLALLLLLLAAIVFNVRRGRPLAPPAVIWSGAAAALTTLLVHSGLDFLWQLPVVPLTGALIVGLAAPYTNRAVTRSSAMEVA